MRMRAVLWITLLAGCFPTPSEDYVCTDDSDCSAGRTCGESGFCIAQFGGGGADANTLPDAAPADVMVDADAFAATRAACMAAGYTQESTTGGLYKVVTTNRSWANAQADCADDVPNATHLIVLSSVTEVTYAKTQLGWMGFTDAGTEGVWRNVTGDTIVVTPLPWASGQPDNGGGNENCAQMKAGGMDDDQCGNGHRYVCECDGRASTP